MSNETIIGILVTVIIGVSAFFITTKKVIIKPKTKSGSININNSTIGNEVNKNDKK